MQLGLLAAEEEVHVANLLALGLLCPEVLQKPAERSQARAGANHDDGPRRLRRQPESGLPDKYRNSLCMRGRPRMSDDVSCVRAFGASKATAWARANSRVLARQRKGKKGINHSWVLARCWRQATIQSGFAYSQPGSAPERLWPRPLLAAPWVCCTAQQQHKHVHSPDVPVTKTATAECKVFMDVCMVVWR